MNTKFLAVRYGELILKGKNRFRFEDALENNVIAKLRQFKISRTERQQGRILIEFEKEIPWDNIKNELKMIFGFSTASPVIPTGLSMADIEKTLVSKAAESDFSSFVVRVKRANKHFPKTSVEIEAHLGEIILDNFPDKKVELRKPDRTFFVDILDDKANIMTERFAGPGGLPVGVSGNVLALLSGGIDSPVAAWNLMRRGCVVDFIHFHSAPFTNKESIEKVEDMATELTRWERKSRIALVPFGELQKKIVTSAPARYRVILYRRFMIRIANIIAKRFGCDALVTGEALGQVASQTLTNIGTVEAVSDLPILRPLIGMGKQEITDMAIKIGTYKMSIQPHQDCCNFLQPPNPATRTSPRELEEVEQALDVNELVAKAVEMIEEK